MTLPVGLWKVGLEELQRCSHTCEHACACEESHTVITTEGLLAWVSPQASSRTVLFSGFLCLHPCSLARPRRPPSVWDAPPAGCMSRHMNLWWAGRVWSGRRCKMWPGTDWCIPALAAVLLHVACSGLLRNSDQNHKWIRWSARWHKTYQSGSCFVFSPVFLVYHFTFLRCNFLVPIACFHCYFANHWC